MDKLSKKASKEDIIDAVNEIIDILSSYKDCELQRLESELLYQQQDLLQKSRLAQMGFPVY